MFDSCLSEFGCRRRQGKIQRPVNAPKSTEDSSAKELSPVALDWPPLSLADTSLELEPVAPQPVLVQALIATAVAPPPAPATASAPQPAQGPAKHSRLCRKCNAIQTRLRSEPLSESCPACGVFYTKYESMLRAAGFTLIELMIVVVIIGIGHLHEDPSAVMSYVAGITAGGRSSTPSSSDYASCNLAVKNRFGIDYTPPPGKTAAMSDKDAAAIVKAIRPDIYNSAASTERGR